MNAPHLPSFRRASLLLLAVSLWAAVHSLGCSLIVDFDASKIDSGIVDSGGVDAEDAADGADAADALPPAALTITPTPADFGSVVVGSTKDVTLTVSNASGTSTSGAIAFAISGTGAAQFTLKATGSCVSGTTTLDAGRTCTIDVSFAPTAAGDQAATLTVSATPGGTTSAALAGKGLSQAALAITPTTGDFGSVVVGTKSADATFTVSNPAGSADAGALAIALAGTDAADFGIGADNCTGKVLKGGDTCTVTVHLSPASTSAVGAKSASIQATGTPGGTASASLTGTVLAAAAITISPTPKDFGPVLVGATSGATFTVSNAPSAATTTPITIALGGTDASEFQIASTGTCVSGTTTLAGGASCTVDVTFAPKGVGSKMASLSASATTGGSAAAALTGTGQSAAALAISPTTQAFGGVQSNSSSADATFTISNPAGSATSGAITITITGTDASQFVMGTTGTCVSGTTTLAGGASCTATVHFSPTSTGAKTGSISVTATPGGTVSASLSGTGLAPAAISISPTSKSFGDLLAGASSADATFTVTNATGSATTGALGISITGSDAAQFQITGGTCTSTTTLAGAASCTVTAKFAPLGSAAAGPKSATLQIAASPGGTATAALSGNVLAPAALKIDLATWTFSDTVVGANSAPKTFTISNAAGDATTGPIAFSITGTDAAQFSITGGGTCTAGQTLAGGASCTVEVTFTPSAATAPGAKTASLEVTATPGGTVTATLNGRALAPAALSISPSSGTFGSVVQGSSAAAQTFTISNAASAQTTGTLSITIGGTDAAQFTLSADTCTGNTLVAGASCTVMVAFTPSVSAPIGPATADLQATATPGTTVTAALSGTVLAPAKLSVDTTSFTFPGVGAGGSTAGQTFTFSNAVGAQTTGTITTALSGTDAAQFAIVTDNCNGKTLAAAATCTVIVRFSPSSAATPGAKSAMLQASATPGGTASVTLGGQVLAPAALSIAPSPQDFGAVTMGGSSTPIAFTVTNTGGLATGTLQVGMSGTNATDFVVSSDLCSGKTVSAGATCTFVVTFSPPSGGVAGGRSATVSVTDGTASTSASLTGTAQ